MSTHAIDDFVRVINADTFCDSAHGAGHRVVLVDKRAGPYKKSLLGSLLGPRGAAHYFVKQWAIPKEVKGWQFHWSEGTNAISLDFESSFVIQANEDTQAYRLVESLSSGPNPGDVLYELVNSAISGELNRLLDESNRKAISLLDIFKRSSIGIGESEELNIRVGERVRTALGGAVFRIGLRLRNAPPMQVEVTRTADGADVFTLADSRRLRKAETTALLRLDNYQVFKKSGLHSEDDVRAAVGHAIASAVKELLFARKYYDVVRSFTRGDDPIEKQMRRRIEEEARTIGFGVKMFQSLPDVAALSLLEPVRIDIAAEEKYDLKNAVGYVQFSVSLMTQLGADISRLHLLIDPDSEDVVKPISARVRQICRDTMQRFDHLAFNLRFEADVAPALHKAIGDGLADCGLSSQIINIRQAPTEDALRFKAIRGRTIDFEVLIRPQANRGQADAVPTAGTIEVVSMLETGWEPFQSKDFGYRSDSAVTEQRMRLLAERLQVQVSSGVWSDDDRRSIAVDLEMAEIRQRVGNILEAKMSMGPDLAEHWTTAKNSQQIGDWATRLAADAIGAEFGLVIEVRAFRRLDTETDTTAQITREAHHAVVRAAARGDAESALAHERQEREVLDANRIKLIQGLGRRERDALDDPDSEEGREVAEQLRRDLQKSVLRPRLNSDRALEALAPRGNLAATTAQLPWAPPEPFSPDAGPEETSDTG